MYVSPYSLLMDVLTQSLISRISVALPLRHTDRLGSQEPHKDDRIVSYALLTTDSTFDCEITRMLLST